MQHAIHLPLPHQPPPASFFGPLCFFCVCGCMGAVEGGHERMCSEVWRVCSAVWRVCSAVWRVRCEVQGGRYTA